MIDIGMILALIAFLLAAIDEWNAQGKALTSWGVMALALIVILGGLKIG